MTDTAGAQDLPDAGSLQPPPDLPDVGSLTEAQTLPPMRGIAGMPSYSPAVVARLRNGDPVSRVIGKLADGFATGYGNAFSDITAEDQATMAKAGYKPVTPEDMGTIGGTLRFFGHALMDDVSRVKAGVLSFFPAAVEAARQGVTQGAKEVGLEAGPGGTAEQAGEGAAGFAEFMGTDAGIQTMLMSRAQYAEATRIMPNPAGGHFDQRIGPVPDHVEAAQQAAQVAEHYGLDIAPAVTEAYGKGILPAEIHADAKTDPTILPDLIEGKIPGAYPVSTWMGEPQALGSMPVIDTAETARLSRETSLNELDSHLAEQQAALPVGDVSAQDRFNRLETVQDQLANPELTAPERKALMDRRDQILIDTNPEALKAAAQPLIDRRNIEAQRSRVAEQLADIQQERDAARTQVSLAEQPKMQGGPSMPVRTVPEQTSKTAPEVAAGKPAAPIVSGKPAAKPEGSWREGLGPLEESNPRSASVRGTSTRLRPIQGTGELTSMQLSQSVEEAVGKEFEGVPASRVASNEVQEVAARKFVDLDPERADQVAMFGATPPKNLLGQMVYNEVVRRAAATGDFDKLRMLATQSTQPGILRRSGQEIQAASQLGDGNAAADMTRVHETRQAALKAQGVDVAANENTAAAEYAPIRAATRAAKGPDAWAKFLSAIQCAE